MAETKRMTADEVVSYLLAEEGLDFLRESLTWVVQQLMEAEVTELVGAERGDKRPCSYSPSLSAQASPPSGDNLSYEPP